MVSSEIGGLFDGQSAMVVRWDGDTIRVIGSWRADSGDVGLAGAVLSYGATRSRRGSSRRRRRRASMLRRPENGVRPAALGRARVGSVDRRADHGRPEGVGRRGRVAERAG